MTWWMWAIVAAYWLGFAVAYWVNATMGPVTFGLTLLRALLWPLWIVGLIPGERQ